MSNDHIRGINQSGEALLKAINSVVQIARMHLDNNDLLVDSAKKFIRTIQTADRRSAKVSIQISEGRFYFQEEKLYLRNANARLFNHMLRFMENRNIFGFHFQSDLKAVKRDKIIGFARLLDRAVRHDDPSDWLCMQLDRHKLSWVAIDRSMPSQFSDVASTPSEVSLPEELALKKKQVRKSYAHILSSVKEVAQKLTSDQTTGMRNSVRLVQGMVDTITEDESLFLGISTIRVFDDYTYVHSLNVAILAMCIGKRIGLAHRTLERLGLCGLFHDLGKVEIPKQILNKKGKLNSEEFDRMKDHSMHSARLILKLKAKRDRKVRLLVPPFEHHMGYDLSGYPKIGQRHNISLFGKILTIADVYDAITSPRIYRPNPMSPDKALGQMLSQSGTHFDPLLLKVFINMLGLYPVGSLLKLDSGELGVVIQSSGRHDPTRPLVQLLVPHPDQRFTNGSIVDLSAKDPQTGEYDHNIVESLHPSSIGIQPAAFLLS